MKRFVIWHPNIAPSPTEEERGLHSLQTKCIQRFDRQFIRFKADRAIFLHFEHLHAEIVESNQSPRAQSIQVRNYRLFYLSFATDGHIRAHQSSISDIMQRFLIFTAIAPHLCEDLDKAKSSYKNGERFRATIAELRIGEDTLP